MPRRTSPLAKLTRPRLHAALPRERLFALLDAYRSHPVIWVTGPPGAGKTTLAASWLETRGLPGIWYQLDSIDADPATFFYYLRLAAAGIAAKRRAALPLLTPEYLPDLTGFTRRWFRELFSRLPNPVTLALDNYQEVAVDSVLHRVIEAAVDEMPVGANLIVLSRSGPPPPFARLQASERLALMEWDDLRLTLDEARGIASDNDGLNDDTIRALHQECDGWAAGFTLMRERTRRTGRVNRISEAQSMEAVFNYFAAQIFDAATVEDRETLVHTAFLPRMTVVSAESISGNPRAGKLLDFLYQRHLFTDRRHGAEISYQYHALFRAFLLAQAHEYYAAPGRAQLTRRAADLMAASGQADAAVALYLDARDWRAASDLIIKLAANLVAQGRGQTLREWIAALPLEQADSTPWLGYWAGTALIGVSLSDARKSLERAYAGFCADADEAGQIMAAAGVLETYYFEAHDFHPTDKWIAIIERLVREQASFATPEAEAKVCAVTLGMMFWRQPHHSLVFTCLDRVMSLLQQDMDPNQKVATACFVIEFLGIAGYPEQANRLIQLITPEFKNSGVLPLYRAAWLSRLTHYQQYCLAAFDDARKGLDEALAIATENGFQHFINVIHGLRSESELALGNLTAAETTLEQMRASLPREGGRRAIGRYHNLYANVAVMKGDLDLALHHAETAFALGRESGGTLLQSFFGRTLVMVLLERGELDRAEAILAIVSPIFPPDRYPALRRQVQFLYAYLASLRGDRKNRDRILRSALAESKKQGYFNLVRPPVNSRLCQIALLAGIEVDYIQSIIRKHRISPPSPDIENWPWPIKISTLGKFALQVDDEPVVFSSKAPKKTIALLKAVIAFGAEDVPMQRLSDALWPELEGDDARQAFKIALHRLRKLVRVPEAIRLHEGGLSLDSRRCWVDAAAFEQLCDKAEQHWRRGADADGMQSAEQALRLYRGAFLAIDIDEPWTFSMRERLRGRFIHLLSGHARRLAKAGQFDRTIDCYLRGLAADDLAEDFYQGLMRCYQQTGRRAEALAIYRRLRQTLSVTLGVDPSAGSEALYRSLRSG